MTPNNAWIYWKWRPSSHGGNIRRNQLNLIYLLFEIINAIFTPNFINFAQYSVTLLDTVPRWTPSWNSRHVDSTSIESISVSIRDITIHQRVVFCHLQRKWCESRDNISKNCAQVRHLGMATILDALKMNMQMKVIYMWKYVWAKVFRISAQKNGTAAKNTKNYRLASSHFKMATIAIV